MTKDFLPITPWHAQLVTCKKKHSQMDAPYQMVSMVILVAGVRCP
jgi:hypothetical protein